MPSREQIVSGVLRNFIQTNPGLSPFDPQYQPHIQGDIGAELQQEEQFQDAFSHYSAMLPPTPSPTLAQNFRSSFAQGSEGRLALAYGISRFGDSAAQSYAAQNSGVFLTPEQQAQSNLGMAPGAGAVIGAGIGAFFGQPVLGGGIGAAVGSGVQAAGGAGLDREQAGRLSSQEFAGATGASVESIRKVTDALTGLGVATQQVAQLMTTLTAGPGVTTATATYAVNLSRDLGTFAPTSARALDSTLTSSPILYSSFAASHSQQGSDFYADASVIAAGQGNYEGSRDIRLQVNAQRQRDLSKVADYDRGKGSLNPFTADYWHQTAEGFQRLIGHRGAQAATDEARLRLAHPDTSTAAATARADAVSGGMADIQASLEMGGVDVARAQSALGAEIFRGASAVDIRRDSGTFRNAIEGEIQGIARGRTALVADMAKETDPGMRNLMATWAGQADVSINALRLQRTQFGAELTESGYAQREANISVSVARAGTGVAQAQGYGDPTAVYSAQSAEIQKQVALQQQLTEELRKGVPVYEDRIAKEKELAVVSSSIVSARAARDYGLTVATEAIQGAGITGAESLNPRALRLGGDRAFSSSLLGDLDTAYNFALKASTDSPNANERADQKLRADQLLADLQNQRDLARSYIPSAAVSTRLSTDTANYNIAGNLPFIGGLGSNPYTQGGAVIRDLTGQIDAATAKFQSLANPTDIDRQNYAATVNPMREQRSEMERVRMTAAEMSLVTMHEGEGPATRAASSGAPARAAMFSPNSWLSGTWDHIRPDNSFGYSPRGGNIPQAFMDMAHNAGKSGNADVVDALNRLTAALLGRATPMQPQKNSAVSAVGTAIRTRAVDVYRTGQ